jgi:glutathione S-transferase
MHARVAAMEHIRLYTQTINPYAEKVAGALALKRLPFERVVSDLPEDVATWSPVTRQLPVLEVDGERRAGSNPILVWLDERFPEPALVSRDPSVAAAQWRFAEWSDASFVWYWNRWRAARFPRPGDEQPPDPGLLGKLGQAVRRSLGRPGRAPSRADIRELEILSELENRLNDLVGLLGERPFFLAASPSVADLSVYGMLNVLRDSPMNGGGRLLSERLALVAFVERMDQLTNALDR